MSALSPEADMLIVGINVCKCHKQTLGPSDATSPLLPPLEFCLGGLYFECCTCRSFREHAASPASGKEGSGLTSEEIE